MKGDSQEFQMAAQPEGKTLLLLLPFFYLFRFILFFSPPSLSIPLCGCCFCCLSNGGKKSAV
jgi:hypothetical protein